MQTTIANLRQGRFMRRGLTWQSAALTVALIVGAMVAIGALVRGSQPDYAMTVIVRNHQVLGTTPACSWEANIEFRNESDRRLRLISVEIADVEDSGQSLLGGFEPTESIERTYRYTTASCSGPIGEQLIARYHVGFSNKEESTFVTVN